VPAYTHTHTHTHTHTQDIDVLACAPREAVGGWVLMLLRPGVNVVVNSFSSVQADKQVPDKFERKSGCAISVVHEDMRRLNTQTRGHREESSQWVMPSTREARKSL